jgi:hypothetical protein
MVPNTRRRRSPLLVLFLLWSFAPAFAQNEKSTRGVIDTTSQPSTTEQLGPYYALVIGINEYRYLRKLTTAVNDATEVADLLREHYGFETKVLSNATRHEILSSLDHYERTLPHDANLLIYYAGHGLYDKDRDKAYWAPVDAEKETYADWIIADEITSTARAIPARHILIVSDSCYSGMIAPREGSRTMNPANRSLYIDQMLSKKSRNVISSAGKEPVPDGGPEGHSVFAYAFLQGLRGMGYDEFTATELFQLVRADVAGKSDQVPRYDVIRNSEDDGGDFVFRSTSHTSQGEPKQSGAQPPPPEVIQLSVARVPAIPRPLRTPDMSDGEWQRSLSEYQTRKGAEIGPVFNPGLQLTFTVNAMLPNPLFMVHCDHPCMVSLVMIFSNGNASYSGSADFNVETGDPRVVLFHCGNLRVLTPDRAVGVRLRSKDSDPLTTATVESYAH